MVQPFGWLKFIWVDKLGKYPNHGLPVRDTYRVCWADNDQDDQFI